MLTLMLESNTTWQYDSSCALPAAEPLPRACQPACLDTCLLAYMLTLALLGMLSLAVQDLVDFVKRAEQAQKRAGVPEGQPIPGFGPSQATPILRDFGSR